MVSGERRAVNGEGARLGGTKHNHIKYAQCVSHKSVESGGILLNVVESMESSDGISYDCI